MTGDELRRLRERRGLDRAELADATNQALGTTYSAETVARWERGSRQVSKKAGAFFQELAVSDFTDTVGGDAEPVDDLPPAGDVPPGPGPGAEPQRALTTGGGVYVKACEELWEMIAAGVGMLGAATGNMALVNDGAVIAGDKAALGAAWGKLAETNDTFRRMLVGMTEGGAWLQVALVTGTTFSKCWQGHVIHSRQTAEQPTPGDDTYDGQVERDHLGEAA